MSTTCIKIATLTGNVSICYVDGALEFHVPGWWYGKEFGDFRENYKERIERFKKYRR